MWIISSQKTVDRIAHWIPALAAFEARLEARRKRGDLGDAKHAARVLDLGR
jgi:hypothetical protein